VAERKPGTVTAPPPVGVERGIGAAATRPDGPAKVRGEFAFSSDLWTEAMLWGATVRSPHPYARILRIDTGPALAIPGTRAVLTARDVPGRPTYGIKTPDQPVFASHVTRYAGEPVAAVAATSLGAALAAAAAVRVEYEVMDPLVDPEVALLAEPIHPDGNVFRHVRLRHGDPDATGGVVVEGTYTVGMQDQAFLGTESALAIPDGNSVDLFVSTQSLHGDHVQVAACLGLPSEQVRLHQAGVGGAFGGREDLSVHVHACLLALRTGRGVKMHYSRAESFHGHVHRHPARMWYRHHADHDGSLVKVEARILFDGGAYASTSQFVIGNAVAFAVGPYRVPSATIDGWAVRTNNPPCGSMRGLGTPQVCFAHEAQMDRLAAELDLDPVEIRLRNALRAGDRLVTGQRIDGVAPVTECLQAAAAFDLPPPSAGDALTLPGGAGLAAAPGRVARGVGYAVGFKNLMSPEGRDDYSTARVRLELGPGNEPVATVCCAAAEVGQGFVTLAQQITRTELGVDHVVLTPPDTTMGSAGSSSASRQAWMSGGAIQQACRAIREQLRERALAAGRSGSDDLPLDDLLAAGPIEAEFEHHHAPTTPLDEDGQGAPHVAFAFVAHRAVVDVDLDLGLVKVVELATGQDVGRALNPAQVIGQIEGGSCQGLGLALMEEVVVEGGHIVNPSFTDYLIPTALDMPPVRAELIEIAEPSAPFGAKGVGEPPIISSPAAIAAAVRNATGAAVSRIPMRPEDLLPATPKTD
jgi:CO/xanthine dehydrogenase Mo-binding subunit